MEKDSATPYISKKKVGTEFGVEAHEDFIPLIKKNRPNSMVVHAAAAEEDQEITTFYANTRGSLSTLDPNKEKEFSKKYKKHFASFEEQSVPKKTLSSIFDAYNTPQIDFLSLDIEGYELEALKGLDLSRHRPVFLVIECDARSDFNAVKALLEKHEYRFSGMLKHNAFFTTDQAIANSLENLKPSKAPITETPHPLDQAEEKTKERSVRVIKRYYSLLDRIKDRLIG